MVKSGQEVLTILVVDDDREVLLSMEGYLKLMGYRVLSAVSLESAEEFFSNEFIDIILLDVKFPEESGLDYIQRFKARNPLVGIIMLSGVSDLEVVIESIRLGADDYLTKPVDFDRLRLALIRAEENKNLREENYRLRSQLDSTFKYTDLVGKTPAMLEMFRYIEKFAPLDSTVFIIGETGTGKELVARTIHALSPRASMEFIPINCGGIAETLLDSQLFGYEKGAFTGAYKKTKGYFEKADGGTIFLDEVTETSNSFQIKLLRVLQEKTINRVGGTETIPVNVRVIAATNRSFEELTNPAVLRRDLFYRLNVLTITVPPLRKRLDDIPLLVNHFINKYNEIHKRKVKRISPDVIKIFKRYSWKGNVRELENIIERAVALSDGEEITLELLPSYLSANHLTKESYRPDMFVDFFTARENFERQYFRNLLKNTNFNITKAARLAGIARQNLHKKIKKLFPDGIYGEPDKQDIV